MNELPSAESRIVHAGTQRHPGAPAAPPLVPASVYASWGEPDPARAYGRNGNPTWEALEQALGVLEDAEAVVFASGPGGVDGADAGAGGRAGRRIVLALRRLLQHAGARRLAAAARRRRRWRPTSWTWPR